MTTNNFVFCTTLQKSLQTPAIFMKTLMLKLYIYLSRYTSIFTICLQHIYVIVLQLCTEKHPQLQETHELFKYMNKEVQ